MLHPVDLFNAVLKLSPRQQMIYKVGVNVSSLVVMAASVAVIGGLSALMARQIVDSNVTVDGVWGAVIMPALMAFVFVISGLRRRIEPGASLPYNLLYAGRRSAVAGFVVGFAVVAVSHFLGQLLMTRALYGAIEFQSKITSYCAPLPLLYGALFAIPVALGCALYGAYVAVSGEVVYRLVKRLPDQQVA